MGAGSICTEPRVARVICGMPLAITALRLRRPGHEASTFSFGPCCGNVGEVGVGSLSLDVRPRPGKAAPR